MSQVKDRERAREFVYRDGVKVSRSRWDKYQRELRELGEVQRLKALGLTGAKPKILTLDEVMKERRPVGG